MKDKLEYIRATFARARSDLKIARGEMKTQDPATDAVCFHFQQAVEKMLKAWLIWQEVNFRPIHNIEVLLSQCEATDPTFSQLRAAETLTPYAVDVRYGDDFYMPTLDEVVEAAKTAKQVEALVVAKFASVGVDVTHESQ